MPSTYQLANERMLALLKAADAIPERTAEHLQAAAAINGWLIESEGEQPVHLVNKWQIEWRDGGLSESRRAEIRKFKRSLTITAPSMTAELGLACALLLGDDHEIASIVDELDERQRASMESWPIWHLNQHSN